MSFDRGMKIARSMKGLHAARFSFLIAVLVPMLCAQTANVNDLFAIERKQIETADFRVTGHLVAIDATGARVNYPITIKTHWFPGVLREFVDLGQPPSTKDDLREHVLIEMRSNGEHTIQIVHPGETVAHMLPFEKWDIHPLGPGFNYEDFLEQQYLWPGQASEGTATFGARNCDVVKSTPGPTDRTHYEQVKTWVDPTIDFPVYAEKTFKESGTVKEFTSYGVRQEEGHWFAHQVEIKTRGQAGSTLLIFDRGSAKAKLSAADFSPAALTHF
jgi:Outer membrane lipoprotein-sorting protein